MRPSLAIRAMQVPVPNAARSEVCGDWAWAVRRPHMWLTPAIADLSLTSMARGRHALSTGRLLTKSQAIEQADAPRWLVDHLRARRSGEQVTSPRLRTGWIAFCCSPPHPPMNAFVWPIKREPDSSITYH